MSWLTASPTPKQTRKGGLLRPRNQAAAITYLLRDEFTTDEAAPLASPRTCEPGPGTLTLTDATNKMSISSGALQVAGVNSSGDPGVWGGALARAAGRVLRVVDVNLSSTNHRIMLGWDVIGAAGLPDEEALYFKGTGDIRTYLSTEISIGAFAASTAYQVATVLRSAGMFYLVKGGAYADWTLLWISVAKNSASLYPGVIEVAGSNGTASISAMKVSDLPAPWDTDYGIATDRLAGSVSAGTTFTHEADCLVEWTQTTVPSSGQVEVRFRTQDASNYWQVTVDSSGNLDLDEVVSGTPTQRGTSAGVIANGDRIAVIADDTTIKVYEANILRITYSSASNFKTETSGELETLGTGGAVSDLISWPRTLSGAALSSLEAV